MLYHYTDFAAFDGIIRCAELRLNNILNMNDAAEMRLFMNGICKAVIEKLIWMEKRKRAKKRNPFLKMRWKKNFTIPHMLHVFPNTEMMQPNGSDMVTWDRAYVLPFRKTLCRSW